MPVSIKSTGGGSTTLAAPNTASDYTITFPAMTGTPVVANSTTGAVEISPVGSSGTALLTIRGSETTENYSGALRVLGSSYPYIGLEGASNLPYNGAFEFWKYRGTRSSPSIVQSGDYLGSVVFVGYDGSAGKIAASIDCLVNGTPGTNDMPGALTFSTTPDGTAGQIERMRISQNGAVAIGTSADYAQLVVYGGAGYASEIGSGRTGGAVASYGAYSTSFDWDVLGINCYRANTSAYSFFTCFSGNYGDVEFRLRGDGEAFADGSWSGGGADYAEYFEWADGNAANEDRRGLTVVLDGHKVRPALATDAPASIIGAVSVNPTVIGDAAWNMWTDKYLTDDYGSYVLEDYEVWEWTEKVIKPGVGPGAHETVEDKPHSYAFDAVPEGLVVPVDKTVIIQQRRKLNPAYDPAQEYVPREKRPEWVTIGLMGKLRIRKGQPVGDRWLKMRDISDTVEEWLVR